MLRQIRALLESRIEPQVETRAVEHAGQRIVQRRMLQRLARSDLVVDIVQAPDGRVRSRFVIGHGPRADACPELGFTGPAQLPVALVGMAGIEGRLRLLAKLGVVGFDGKDQGHRMAEQVLLAAGEQAATFGADEVEAVVAREGQADRRRGHHRRQLVQHLRVDALGARALGPDALQGVRQRADLAARERPIARIVGAAGERGGTRLQPGQRPQLHDEIQQQGRHREREPHRGAGGVGARAAQRRQQPLA